MDKILEIKMFANAYDRKRVLITGHTGFKGSWLAFWLRKLGAEICGISLPPEYENNHFSLLNMDFRSEFVDIRNYEKMKEIFQQFQPDMVFHLAAQPLVRRSYSDPAETFNTNVMGTVNVLEAIRTVDSVRAAVLITTDKCYENIETDIPYKENAPLGGFDPYSASKGCAEIVISSYRRSFFAETTSALIASVRAGNVIGGGDWAEDRLVPDLMKAAVNRQSAIIRNPGSIRPWQHVLEPLSGYLMLGEKLLSGERKFADAWNFGPAMDDVLNVCELADCLKLSWPAIKIRYSDAGTADKMHEAGILRLDCTKAETVLGWYPVWKSAKAAAITAEWYKYFYEDGIINTDKNLYEYCKTAEKRGLPWIK